MSLYTEFLDKDACDFCKRFVVRKTEGGQAGLCSECYPKYREQVIKDFKRVTGRGD